MKFIESVCFKKSAYQNLKWHQDRINRTFNHFFKKEAFQLEPALPKIDEDAVFKIRIEYDAQNVIIQPSPYSVRQTDSIQLVQMAPFDYRFKYCNREIINQALQQSEADDIIMVSEGELTDASYANIVFWDGSQWFTPSSFLLNGVKRQALLSTDKIQEARILPEDIYSFQKVALINAMLDLGDLELSVDQLQMDQC